MSEGDQQDDPDDPYRAYAPPALVEPSERGANDEGFPPRPSDSPPGTAVVEGWIVIMAFIGFTLAILAGTGVFVTFLQ
ncbi:MAG TPA: hypothetical protein VGN57_09575 [Pirellulaceae bacterium]|jgi:hypothetical protein|nr:hypothetical protein [Pirellulaceae bacterium]